MDRGARRIGLDNHSHPSRRHAPRIDRRAMSLFRAVKAVYDRVPEAETQRLTLSREDAEAVLRLAGVSV